MKAKLKATKTRLFRKPIVTERIVELDDDAADFAFALDGGIVTLEPAMFDDDDKTNNLTLLALLEQRLPAYRPDKAKSSTWYADAKHQDSFVEGYIAGYYQYLKDVQALIAELKKTQQN